MVFQITIRWSNYIYPLIVVQIGKDNRHEQYKIYNPKSPEKYIVIQNNRPFLLSKGLKKRRWDWEVLEGKITYQNALDNAIKAIERHLKPPPLKSTTDWNNVQFKIVREHRKKNHGQDMQDWGAIKREEMKARDKGLGKDRGPL